MGNHSSSDVALCCVIFPRRKLAGKPPPAVLFIPAKACEGRAFGGPKGSGMYEVRKLFKFVFVKQTGSSTLFIPAKNECVRFDVYLFWPTSVLFVSLFLISAPVWLTLSAVSLRGHQK